MKIHFQSTEGLAIRFLPHVNKMDLTYITGGIDTVTLTIRKPDGSLLSGGPHLAVYDAAVDIWEFTVSPASFMVGEWRIRADSDNINAKQQWMILWWGGYIDKITEAAVSAGQAAGSSALASTAATIIRKITTNRWKIDAQTNQLFVYDDDGVSPFFLFDLKNENGQATAHRIFERVPTGG